MGDNIAIIVGNSAVSGLKLRPSGSQLEPSTQWAIDLPIAVKKLQTQCRNVNYAQLNITIVKNRTRAYLNSINKIAYVLAVSMQSLITS